MNSQLHHPQSHICLPDSVHSCTRVIVCLQTEYYMLNAMHFGWIQRKSVRERTQQMCLALSSSLPLLVFLWVSIPHCRLWNLPEKRTLGWALGEPTPSLARLFISSYCNTILSRCVLCKLSKAAWQLWTELGLYGYGRDRNWSWTETTTVYCLPALLLNNHLLDNWILVYLLPNSHGVSHPFLFLSLLLSNLSPDSREGISNENAVG